MDNVIFGTLSDASEIEAMVPALNSLLQRAYRALAESGLRYNASHEDEAATRKNLREAECHVGFLDGTLVACANLRTKKFPRVGGWRSKHPEWYQRADVANFGRFAVRPDLQARGIGARMMDRLESRALELGFAELALDTAESAEHLIRFYASRGYRVVGHNQWPTTNYRSVVMSKRLG